MFNIALEEVIRNIKTNLNGTIFKRTRQYVAYTDDVVMLRRSLRATEVAVTQINPLNPELNSICYLLALLGAHHILHVSRIRVKLLTFRLLMSYIYIWSTHS